MTKTTEKPEVKRRIKQAELVSLFDEALADIRLRPCDKVSVSIVAEGGHRYHATIATAVLKA